LVCGIFQKLASIVIEYYQNCYVSKFLSM